LERDTVKALPGPPKPVYKIGDRGPGGGIVFAVEGNTGMEVSRLLGDYNWDDAVKAVQDYTGGGYNDWYLPSRSELNLIYENLQKAGVVNLGGADLGSGWYWSSSQCNYNFSSWVQYFGDGRQNYEFKIYSFSVRCVRAF
jgi:hypothetical protein